MDCARRGCASPVPERAGPGRPRKFCSDGCARAAAAEQRQMFEAAGRAAAAVLAGPPGLADVEEVPEAPVVELLGLPASALAELPAEATVIAVLRALLRGDIGGLKVLLDGTDPMALLLMTAAWVNESYGVEAYDGLAGWDEVLATWQRRIAGADPVDDGVRRPR